MSRRMSRADALIILATYIEEEHEKHPLIRQAPGGRRKLAADARARLNRAARRALGDRGDGRFHPLATGMAIPRGRTRTKRSARSDVLAKECACSPSS